MLKLETNYTLTLSTEELRLIVVGLITLGKADSEMKGKAMSLEAKIMTAKKNILQSQLKQAEHNLRMAEQSLAAAEREQKSQESRGQ